ncbi:MAG: ferrous iron transporter B, partial [Eubacterium sp.]|nr:ferrous iron transporter B [Eubacterium sp.]
MGLTNHSTGRGAMERKARRRDGTERVVALAGNPNVGKSTVFNALTGMNQHTGNWPGKTVTNAEGIFKTARNTYLLTDLPGTYSLMAHSAEEETARNFLCFGGADAAVVLCDATCLERNLNLALQTMEITERVILCVNLMDEAKRKGIVLDLDTLSERLGVPVVGITARKKGDLDRLVNAIERMTDGETATAPLKIRYLRPIEEAVALLLPAAETAAKGKLDPRWLALKLLEGDEALLLEIDGYLGGELTAKRALDEALGRAWEILDRAGITRENLKDRMVSSIVLTAEELCLDTVRREKKNYDAADRRADRILTSRRAGYPIMLLLLLAIFWLTIAGANLPSELLMSALFGLGDLLREGLNRLAAPEWLVGLVVDGAYKVLAWVVSVMLPPMAIFFALFTLLEDAGYLPRVAYN